MIRRRRLALAALAVTALAAGITIGSRAGGGSAPSGGPGAARPACPVEIATSARRLAGQMLVVRMEATATPALLRRVGNGRIGGVILFPPPELDPAALRSEIAALGRAAAGSAAPPPLVAIDQEGGDVRRLPSLPPDAAPATIAAAGERRARADGRATARALAALGIGVDLAPVLDVPVGDGAFIAPRAFSGAASEVALVGTAFGTALQRHGVAATAKHFPGLDSATANTDLEASTIVLSRRRLEAGLTPFRAAIEAGFDLVMVSNATYPALDPRRPASQSPRVVERLLRGRLGYRGVVISDDLGAGALAAAGLDEGEAAVGAARAGVDLLLFALSDGSAARRALARAIRAGELERPSLLASCARTVALREALSG